MASPHASIDAPFEIRASALHGSGLFASRDIAPGEIVLQEGSSWMITKDEALKSYPFHRQHATSSENLLATLIRAPFTPALETETARRSRLGRIFALHGGFTSYEEAMSLDETDAPAFVKKMSDIFLKNAIPRTQSSPTKTEETPYCAVFTTAARINHHCDPNVQVFVRHDNKNNVSARVVALCGIKKGTEITRTYVNLLLPSKTRRELLDFQWGITCRCVLCTRPPHRIAASDAKRARFNAACERIEKWHKASQKEKPIGMSNEQWEKKQEEACDGILGKDGIGVVHKTWKDEPGLDCWHLFESFNNARKAAQRHGRLKEEAELIDVCINIQRVLQLVEPDDAQELFERKEELAEEASKQLLIANVVTRAIALAGEQAFGQSG